MMRPIRYMACALLLAVACGRPASEEFFVRTSDRDEAGRYCFRMDFADSTAVFDMDLLVCLRSDDMRFARFRQMPLQVRWTAPSGQLYGDSLWVNRKNLSDSTYYDKNFWIPYRRSMRPVEAGEWSLALILPENLIKTYEILGTGVRLTRKKTEEWDTAN